MIYCKVSHSRGYGLGNRLFAWARCRIFSHINNIPMLSVHWPRLAFRVFLRGGIDLKNFKSKILLWGLFNERPEEIKGIKRLRLQYFAEKVPEPKDVFSLSGYRNTCSDIVIIFEGIDDFFHKLNGWDAFLYKEIQSITKSYWLSLVDVIRDVPIGMHVRLGDFSEASLVEDFSNKGAVRTPLCWFIESLKAIRKLAGFPVKAYVVSDGYENELEDLLRLENVVLFRSGSAISDLLLLSRAKILLGSRDSTFSAWASFFGQMPTIYHSMRPEHNWHIINRNKYYTGAFDPALPLEPFVSQVSTILEVFRS